MLNDLDDNDKLLSLTESSWLLEFIQSNSNFYISYLSFLITGESTSSLLLKRFIYFEIRRFFMLKFFFGIFPMVLGEIALILSFSLITSGELLPEPPLSFEIEIIDFVEN